MDKKDYENAVLEMLKDEEFYAEKKDDMNSQFEKTVNEVVSKMQMDGYVESKEADYLLEIKPETPRFYTLPKIHKGFDPFPSQRPIVSGRNSVCERLSNFVDFHQFLSI